MNTIEKTMVHDYDRDMLKFLKWLIASLLISMLASCATSPAPDNTAHTIVPWKTRLKELRTIQQWQITGSASVQNQMFLINPWNQCSQTNYDISLSGPLGLDRTNLTNSAEGFTLQKGSDIHHANNPEELMNQELGWSMPVEDLYYWVRGIPVPGIPASITLDPYRHLETLAQAGWTVHYLAYTQADGQELPSRMSLSSDKVQAEIAISHWTLKGQCGP